MSDLNAMLTYFAVTNVDVDQSFLGKRFKADISFPPLANDSAVFLFLGLHAYGSQADYYSGVPVPWSPTAVVEGKL